MLVARDREARRYGDGTLKAVSRFQREHGLDANGTVDRRTAEAINALLRELGLLTAPPAPAHPPEPTHPPSPPSPPDNPDTPEPLPEFQHLVRGVVRYQDGLPIPGITVRAFNKQLRREDPLGEPAVTDADGLFEIFYSVESLRTRARESPPLVVRAYGKRQGDGEPSVLAESEVRFHSAPIEKVVLRVESGIEHRWSRFEQLVSEITPLLDGAPIESLVEDEQRQEISYVSGRIGVELQEVAQLAGSHKLAVETGVPAEVYFGFARKRLPFTLSEILGQTEARRRTALVAAIAELIIPGRLLADFDKFEARFRELAAQRAVARSAENVVGPLAAMLDAAGVPPPAQQVLATRFVEHKGPIRSLWKALGKADGLGDHAPSAQLALQVGTLTGGNVKLVQKLLSGESRLTHVRELASLTEKDWLGLVNDAAGAEGQRQFPDAVPGKDEKEKAASYARVLSRMMRDAFPVETLAHRTMADESVPASTRTFFRNLVEKGATAGLDLARTPIDRFIAENPAMLEGVGDRNALVRDLKTRQRLFKIAPAHEQVSMLMKSGIESSSAIARMGRRDFTRQFSGTLGGDVEAMKVHAQAEHVVAGTLDVMANLGPWLRNPLYALPQSTPDVDGVPDWTTLFGHFDLCRCEQCQTVHGPAAYFAELMAYIDERRVTLPGEAAETSLRTLLFRRRPDLGDIELTCENTETPLPYIDLACEVLESAIAPFVPFEIPGAAQGELDARALTTTRTLFANAGHPLTPEHAVIIVEESESWLVTDHSLLYRLGMESGKLMVQAIGYQTSGTADELAANPQHVNAAAYQQLASAVHGWLLPLDMPIEETRVWLDKAGVTREALMRAFQPDAAPRDPDALAIAAETLGLTIVEAQIVTATETVPHQPWEFWGLQEHGNAVEVADPADFANDIIDTLDWVDALAHVDVFLARSDLAYADLLSLLSTRFVNGDGKIGIESIDDKDAATCDLHKLRIAPLDAPALNRMHRFARLLRKLGWTMRELDYAIEVMAGDVVDPAKRIDASLIERLAVVARLRRRTGLPLERVLALWGTIDTRRGLDEDPAGPDSLYHRLFLNATVNKPTQAAFALKADRSELATIGTLADFVPTLSGALGITAAEVNALRATVLVDGKLDLANLSTLLRWAVLAQVAGQPVEDLLRWKTIAGADPFDKSHPETTLALAEAIDAATDAGFTVAEVDYLLCHVDDAAAPLAPAPEAIASALGALRDSLQKIQDTVAVGPDASGELTRKYLGLLKWDSAQVELIASTLNAPSPFSTPVAGLPAVIALPAALQSRVKWDSGRGVLSASAPLSLADRNDLAAVALPAAAQAAWVAAVDALKAQSDDFVAALAAYQRPVFRVALAQASMPAAATIPRAQKARLFHDRKSGELCYSGLMLASAMAELSAIPGVDATFKGALLALRQQSLQFAPDATNTFFDAAASKALLAGDPKPDARFATVLERLVPRLRRLLGESQVRQALADAIGGAPAIMEPLIDAATMDAFLAADFVDSHASLVPDATRFPTLWNAFLRLGKAVLACSRLGLSGATLGQYLAWLPGVPRRDVPWTTGPVVQAGWLDIRTLPLVSSNAAATEALAGLIRLCALGSLRRQIRPAGELCVQTVLDLARRPGIAANVMVDDVAAAIERIVGWPATDIKALLGANGLGLSLPDALKDETGLARIARCMQLLRQLNATAERAREWARATLADAIPRQIKEAQRARRGEREWNALAAPAQDALREKRRAGLVAWLLTRAPIVTRTNGKQAPAWRDSNGLYAHFLIDVEMCACFRTSRIKQAIGSTQMFVQRCLLNLEDGVRVDHVKDDAWRDWRWMKNYRVWEANRKIFLFPENWLEGELRDDKTPFFRDFENELAQNELTDATAEDAFRRYLERLYSVARLEVISLYQQDGGDGLQPVLHVIGRTTGAPAAYYYRSRTGTGRWTPWEKIELDIDGDHVIPIVWNRRLHLFWALFTVKARATVPAKDTAGPPPEKYFEIGLAWSQYRNGGWTPKRTTRVHVSSGVPVTDDPDNDGRNKHIFFTSINSDGLRIWPEWDNPQSSYTTLADDQYGGLHIPGTSPYGTVDTFFFSSGGAEPTVESGRRIYGVYNPTGTHVRAMRFEEGLEAQITVPLPIPGGGIINVPVISTLPFPPLLLPADGTTNKEEVALSNSPGVTPFEIAFAHQDRWLSGNRPFFFEDQSRAFCVDPEDSMVSLHTWSVADLVDPGKFSIIVNHYYGTATKPKPPLPFAGIVQQPAALQPPASGPAPAPGGDAAVMSIPLHRKLEAMLPGAVRSPVAIRKAMNEVNVAAAKPWLDTTEIVKQKGLLPLARRFRQYRFRPFYHPFVNDFIRELNRAGVDAMMTLSMQAQSATPFGEYQPAPLVHPDYPIETVDFSPAGSYSQYNWELFFHAPLMIAERLMRNQRFEEAMRWFHFIFDPTSTSPEEVPGKFWRTKPFHDMTREDYVKQRIKQLVTPRADGQPNPQLVQQIAEWRQNPFSPYAIARMRFSAFQMSVVMKYLDNLIAWSRQLIRRETIESINEGAQLLLLAADILGKQAVEIRPRATPQVQTIRSLDAEVGGLSDKLVDIETMIPVPSPDSVLVPRHAGSLQIPQILYFCIPRNEKLEGYWRTVNDMLYKIRHCMNLDGVVRQLPLFEPPIDPALLVRAAAQGVDIGSVLNDLDAPLPYFRFTLLAQRATELCGEVKSLGAALLASIEKRDAEMVSLLRSSNEIAMLRAIRETRETQVREAREMLVSLENAKVVTEARRDYYRNIERINASEQQHLDKLYSAHVLSEVAQGMNAAASVAFMVPQFDVGVAGWGSSPTVKAKFGGTNLGHALQAGAGVVNMIAAIHSYEANSAQIKGGFDRRWDEWKHQENLASLELKQIDRQIEAARLRVAIAEKELSNSELQVDHARAVDEAMRTRYANRELYEWMVGQVSSVYFQSYQLAFDVCRRAERAFRHELGLRTSSFIQFGYWDALKKGLLAGERLLLDLKRMEAAWLDQNRRELEITRHVSLDVLHPQALSSLREKGECFFELPEAMFDIDFPGHYMRRIKTVSLTIPCVTGPYASIGARLTLLGNRIRTDAQAQGTYAWQGADDPRFVHDLGGIQSIAVSSAQQDSGMFELNFRDERFLPFEGAGAVSQWRLELPQELRQFDYDTISDVVMTVRYTARDGGATLRKAVTDKLLEALNALQVEQGRTGLFRLFSLRHDYSDRWARFVEGGASELVLPLHAGMFPFREGSDATTGAAVPRRVRIRRVVLVMKTATGIAYDADGDPMSFNVTRPGAAAATSLEVQPMTGNIDANAPASIDLGQGMIAGDDPDAQSWKLVLDALPAAVSRKVRQPDGSMVDVVDADKLEDIGLLVRYTVE